jgi:hypothetical protein
MRVFSSYPNKISELSSNLICPDNFSGVFIVKIEILVRLRGASRIARKVTGEDKYVPR